MKAPIALSCLPVLLLALQASMCLASRSGVSRSLLADVILAAGDSCVSGDLCSNGDGTTTVCASGSGAKCPPIPAGLPCKTKDVCKLQLAAGGTNVATPATTVCPADTQNNNGTCPNIPADGVCSAQDRCATDATTTTLCPVSGDSGFATCPRLLSGSTCSALAGLCSGGERCSVSQPATSTTNQDVLYAQDSTAGICVKPKAGGAGCSSGADYCQNQLAGSASQWCPGSSCTLIRPGQTCSQSTPIDRCYNAVNANGAPCDAATCPVLATGAVCFFGDACTANEVCNASGTAAGRCVAVQPAGTTCVDAASATDNSPAQYCRSRVPGGFGGYAAIACTTTKLCPYIPAGQACISASGSVDRCSDGGVAPGTPAGVACSASTCDSVTDACFAGDTCTGTATIPVTSYALCNAQGATLASKGNCKFSVPAGAACVTGDVCKNGALCPDSKFCPIVPAGGVCSPPVDAVTGANAAPARVADKCFNGSPVSGNNSTDCPSGAAVCPSLATGLTCGPTDVCVRGAKCINGKCYPNNKVFASATPSTPSATAAGAAKTASTEVSTAATVPSVTATVVLTNYDVTNFSSVATKYCDTIDANIFTKYQALSNCSTGKAVPGSVAVPTTIALVGADSNSAKSVQTTLVSSLKGGDTTVFGSDYGTVTVAASSVVPGTTANPSAGSSSGAAALGMAWTLGVALIMSALSLSV